ncbi:hypothetical protein [Peribacillus loiseleuriae]|uniref:hypothetical protein n=1 Tax=Peribacillus loiseleuriae TaxID=1679170 RepID=UPI0006716FC3|nr:hypothetical protein [Peribacillus loiseleuriae]
MQILQNTNLLLQKISGQSGQLNIGDTLQVTIKERLNDKEAIISMNGKQFTVKFEGEIPSKDRISIEISGQSREGQLLVKVTDRHAKETVNQQGKPGNIQEQPKQPVSEAVKEFTNKGITVTKENLTSIKKYLRSDSGTIEQKMETLRTMAEKQIPLTDMNVKSVHEALHGASISDTVLSILGEMDASVQGKVPQTRKEDVKSDAPLEKILSKLLTATQINSTLNQDLSSNIPTSLSEQMETSNRKNEVEMSTKIFPETLEIETGTQQISSLETEKYLINEAVQSLKLDSKNVIVKEITEKLSQMAIDFKKMRQEISRNLDNITKIVNHRSNQPTNIQQILESTIHKLDKAILQSDFLLYADMGTEKKLLSASSQLSETKKFLEKGEFAKANQIVKEVKANVESIIFKPSEVKMKHFITEKPQGENLTSAKQVSTLMQQTIQPFTEGSSSRNVYEMVRKLGLTHETETSVSLMTKSDNQDQGQNNENLKAALLRVMRGEDVKPHIQQQAEQAVHQITGQQLLNKQDSSGLQNLFFQLPYLMDKQVENVKIYINSRKNGEKVDWENCSLIFSLETKKLGEIGVVLTAANRNVSLTFKSDQEELQTIIGSMTEITKERFGEIGYQLNSIGVKPTGLKEENKVVNPIVKTQSHEGLQPEKGFDFSI